MIFMSLIALVIVYVKYQYDHPVTQEVVANEHSHVDMTYRYYDSSLPTLFYSYRRNDGSIDSVEYKEFKTAMDIQTARDRIWNAPFKLITRYKSNVKEDVGDAKYIDSIKCIRFNEMLKKMAYYDREDSLFEISVAKIK